MLFILSSIILVNLALSQSETPLALRGMKAQGSPRRKTKNPCVVLISEKEYEDNREEDQPLECELQGDDRNGGLYRMVRIHGVTTKWAKNNKLESGLSTLFAQDAEIDDESNELRIPEGSNIQVGKRNPGSEKSSNSVSVVDPIDRGMIWNRKLQTGVKKVLVIRAVASDRSTTASEAQLSDDIFGTTGDPINLKSQYQACSDRKLVFEPVTTNALVGTDGVYTVTLPTTNVTGASDSVIRTAMINKATADLGSLTSIANYVMLCLPPGTTGGWIAYAYINHWQSVYNDNWCRYPSAQLHEVGHNLNMGHSGEGTDQYGDQSGMMGYSYGLDDGPIMCFNGPKTWQFGWFSAFHVDLPVGSDFAWSGNLIGFSQKNVAATSDKMIVRVRSSTDIYVHFNRMTGFNNGTREGQNLVLVTTRPSGLGYAQSDLKAKLSAGGVYTVTNFDSMSNWLTITVNSIDLISVPARASISIAVVSPTPSIAPFPPTPSPTLKPTPKPTTAKPTPKPTTAKPTASPTTAKPSPAPTTARPTTARPTTANPTSAPTPFPTTANPTAEPTPFPTTESPTAEPTPFPTTESPTAEPTPFPTTEHPTAALTPFPTIENPTAEPTLAPVLPILSPSSSGLPTLAPIIPTEYPTSVAPII